MVNVLIVFEGKKIPFPLDPGRDLQTTLASVLALLPSLLNKPAEHYALRLEATSELITSENVHFKVKEGAEIIVGLNPSIECAEMIQAIKSPAFSSSTKEGDASRNKVIYSLSKFLKDPNFAAEFVNQGGVSLLCNLVSMFSGNMLGYYLLCIQSLMEHESGWDTFTADFINKIVSLIVSPILTVCRGAIAIVIKLVSADKSSLSASVKCYGYEAVAKAIEANKSANIISTLVDRISENDFDTQVNSLNLINVLLKYAGETERSSFLSQIDALNVRKLLTRQMQSSLSNDVAKQIIEFQRLVVQEYHTRKRKEVSRANPDQEKLLLEILHAAELKEGGVGKWRRIGFSTEIPEGDLKRVGVFGLNLICAFVRKNREYYTKFILEQTAKPDQKRCPFIISAIEVGEIVCDYWEISSGYATTNTLHPLLLQIEDVYDVVLQAYHKMWNEMEASAADVSKVTALVRSQLKFTLESSQTGPLIPIYSFKQSMLEVSFATVQQRHLKKLEEEDALINKQPVREIQERIKKEAYEFVRRQRITCLIEGSYFPVFGAKGRVKGQYRYYRLSPNLKFLHYHEFSEGSIDLNRTPTLEQLPEKVDLSTITDIASGKSCPLLVSKSKGAVNENPDLCFSLKSGEESLADFVAASATQFAAWNDGFNMLLERSVTNKETRDYIKTIEELELECILLDIRVEKCEVPDLAPSVPPPPSSMNFAIKSIV